MEINMMESGKMIKHTEKEFNISTKIIFYYVLLNIKMKNFIFFYLK